MLNQSQRIAVAIKRMQTVDRIKRQSRTPNRFDRLTVTNVFCCSSTLVSATNQVYQSLAKLIKLCDDYLLVGEKALNKDTVTEVVNLVDNAIQVSRRKPEGDIDRTDKIDARICSFPESGVADEGQDRSQGFRI